MWNRDTRGSTPQGDASEDHLYNGLFYLDMGAYDSPIWNRDTRGSTPLGDASEAHLYNGLFYLDLGTNDSPIWNRDNRGSTPQGDAFFSVIKPTVSVGFII